MENSFTWERKVFTEFKIRSSSPAGWGRIVCRKVRSDNFTSEKWWRRKRRCSHFLSPPQFSDCHISPSNLNLAPRSPAYSSPIIIDCLMFPGPGKSLVPWLKLGIFLVFMIVVHSRFVNSSRVKNFGRFVNEPRTRLFTVSSSWKHFPLIVPVTSQFLSFLRKVKGMGVT